jgi:hypothetical protein
MNETTKEVLKAGGTSIVGGALGAGLYGTIGGIGLTAVGTGLGVTLGPFIAIGAVIGGAGYGVFSLGRRFEKRKAPNSSGEIPVESE